MLWSNARAPAACREVKPGLRVRYVFTALFALAVLSAVEDRRPAVKSAGQNSRTRVGTSCLACVHGTGVDGGGVSVFSSRGTSVFLHATDDTSRVIEDLQFRLGEGPCVDAAASGEPVMVPDLAASGGDLADRWPTFLAEVAKTEARALFAFPIRVAGVPLGILDLYRRTPGEPGSGRSRGRAVGRGRDGSSLLAPDADENADESHPNS